MKSRKAASSTPTRPSARAAWIPIPRRGVFRGVTGIDEARNIPGIEGLEITAKEGQEMIPLPEGWQEKKELKFPMPLHSVKRIAGHLLPVLIYLLNVMALAISTPFSPASFRA